MGLLILLMGPATLAMDPATFAMDLAISFETALRNLEYSNPCGQSPMDFKSISLATQAKCQVHRCSLPLSRSVSLSLSLAVSCARLVFARPGYRLFGDGVGAQGCAKPWEDARRKQLQSGLQSQPRLHSQSQSQPQSQQHPKWELKRRCFGIWGALGYGSAGTCNVISEVSRPTKPIGPQRSSGSHARKCNRYGYLCD